MSDPTGPPWRPSYAPALRAGMLEPTRFGGVAVDEGALALARLLAEAFSITGSRGHASGLVLLRLGQGRPEDLIARAAVTCGRPETTLPPGDGPDTTGHSHRW